jgi:YHS domain-containing protein
MLLPLIAGCALVLSACATQRAAQNAEPDAPSETTPATPATAAPDTAATDAAAKSCPLPDGAEASDKADSAGPLVAPGLAKVGDRTTCLVSKETFVVKADSPKAEYNGKTYYFCCPHCPAEFQANPAKFVPAT